MGIIADVTASIGPFGTPSPNPPLSSSDSYSVIFVFGSPGAAKGTQCYVFAQEFQLQHLSLGDVLCAERDTSGSEYGELIARNMQEWKIGPMDIAVTLLHDAMKEARRKDRIELFPIDRFPRKIERLQLFELTVFRAKLVFLLNNSDDVRRLRGLKCGNIENRSDDTADIIDKRFDTFASTCMP
ncbi:MAG: hypothetical protein Q9175_001785 [Cornicularia normoerica]